MKKLGQWALRTGSAAVVIALLIVLLLKFYPIKK